MELRHLRYFVAAAEEEHIGRASDRMHVTRPAVSQIISALEQELGTPLFERLPHRVKLTAAGRAMLPKLKGVMNDLDAVLAMAKRVGQGKSGTLNIGYGSLTLLHSIFRAAIKRYHEAYPDVALTLLELHTSEQAQALAEGKIDGGFMHFGVHAMLSRRRRGNGEQMHDPSTLDWYRIQTGGLGVVMPSDHHLARQRTLTLAELADEQFIVVPRSSVSPGYGALHALCQKAGFEPQIVQEVSSIASQLNLVSVGMGIGLVVTGKHLAYPANLAVVPLSEISYTTRFVFGWIKGQRTPALDNMLEIIKELAKAPY
jgi:DNA-binding transcriptional LysR family regulator